MDKKEADFLAKLYATFQEEAKEHIKELSDGLLTLEDQKISSGQRQEIIEKIFREAHSLKGAARSVNRTDIQSICQILENVLSDWKQGTISPNADFFDTLHGTIKSIEKLLLSTSKEDISSILNKLEALTKNVNITPKPAAAPIVSKTRAASSDTNEDDAHKIPLACSLAKENEQPSPSSLAPSAATPHSSTQVSTTNAAIPLQEKTIRISLPKLDRLFQEVEEMLMVKLTSQQQVIDLKQLSIHLRSQEKEWSRLLSEAQVMQHSAPYGENRPSDNNWMQRVMDFLDQHEQRMRYFKEQVNRMTKSSEQNAHFVGSMVDTLLDDMKKVLMQPVGTLFEAMPRMVRDLARELGKEAHLEFQGETIEVDRRILEEIKDPIIHLLRNAIDHGLESPKKRAERSKSQVGIIKMIASECGGSSVEITISDDGGGIEIEKLKEKATKLGLLTTKEVSELSREDAMKLIFHSGISTSPIISELSGRGLGLGIVAEKVDKLGGQVFVESTPSEGTTFRLVLPLTLATFRGIHITVAGQDFIMPTHNVKRVLKLNTGDIKTVENKDTIVVENLSLSYIHLADLLGIRSNESTTNDSHFALVVKTSEKTIAFGVDHIHREHEVLIKSLGKQCLRVKNIMAATIMELGKVIPILNPIDLINSAIKTEIIKKHQDKSLDNKAKKQEILLVEDSITTRLLLKNILESAGFHVLTAADGVEALEILQAQKVDLLLTDVEMPRMDGFTLVEKTKSINSLKDLPVIICTARGSKEDRERGIELGANAYLDKNNFTQQALLKMIHHVL